MIKSDTLLKIILGLIGTILAWQATETKKLNETVANFSVVVASMTEKTTQTEKKTEENANDIKQLKTEFNSYVLRQTNTDNRQDQAINRTAGMVGILPDKIKLEDE